MSTSLVIRGAKLVLPDRTVQGDLLIEEGIIANIGRRLSFGVTNEIDGTGLTILPGGIAPHGQYSCQGLGLQTSLKHASHDALAGGITTLVERPHEGLDLGRADVVDRRLSDATSICATHYGCWGRTTDHETQMMPSQPGVLCAPPSCDQVSLTHLHRGSTRVSRLLVHPEDSERLYQRKLLFEHEDDATQHARIYDIETGLIAVQGAIKTSQVRGNHVHILEVSSAEELDSLARSDHRVTAAVSIHALFADESPPLCRPPIRGGRHRIALWRALHDGVIQMVSSNHVLRTPGERSRPYSHSHFGAPGLTERLPLLLTAVAEGRVSLQQVARWTADAPARMLGLDRKGRLEIGYDADLVLVDTTTQKSISQVKESSWLNWSSFGNRVLTGWPTRTVVLGKTAYLNGTVHPDVRGTLLTCSRPGDSS